MKHLLLVIILVLAGCGTAKEISPEVQAAQEQERCIDFVRTSAAAAQVAVDRITERVINDKMSVKAACRAHQYGRLGLVMLEEAELFCEAGVDFSEISELVAGAFRIGKGIGAELDQMVYAECVRGE